jgi:hypothetical protein
MPIKKQDFYEGAALSILLRAAGATHVTFEAPFFIIDSLAVYLKYCTKVRSPWGFTFTVDEQVVLDKPVGTGRPVIALVCGSDGVATLAYDAYKKITAARQSVVHISCYRRHGEHYGICGPEGELETKVPPSRWHRLLASSNPL